LPLFKSGRIQKILDQGFDVIHYHNISLIGGPKILDYGIGIKLYTMHDYWLLCPMHALFRFNRAPCTERHCFTCALTYKRPPQFWRHLGLLRSNLKQVDMFIAASQFTKQIHTQLGLQAPVVHLPHFASNSLNASTAQRSQSMDRTEKPYFLFVGRLEKLKGPQTLIPVFRRYQKAQLWIVGTGSYERHLHLLTAGNSNIRFLGHQSANNLQSLYRQAVAVITPSICFEMFSLVIVEALMQRTPVIARNIGGMPELVQGSGGGFIYDTEEELLSAMDHLLENPSSRDDFGIRGYGYFQNNWSADTHVKRYLSLIQEIAIKRGLHSSQAHSAPRG
jgi:glycosyltransferase involved in cell wall biosynthesis